MPHKDITGNPKSKDAATRITEFRHPEWNANHDLWVKWRMVYEGGQEFIDTFLQRYSKREQDSDFRDRKAITYNPNHAASLINMVRNALAAKLPEVQRTGDELYIQAMAEDVDTFNSSMSAFVTTEIVPLLLAQGKRFISVDAPSVASETLADDEENKPYIYAINAEDVLSWTYADTRTFDAILIRQVVDTIDDESQLVDGTALQFRYMKMLREGDTFKFKGEEGEVILTGPGVLVRVFGEDDKKKMQDVHDPVVLDLQQIPVVELRLVDSLLKDIGEMQCTLLNLTSSDVSTLHKGNFSIFVQQYDAVEQGIKPHGSKRDADDFDEEVDDDDMIREDDDDITEAGVSKGIAYASGLDKPGFIAPPVENTKLSMEKQNEIARTMRQMLDLSLVSLSTSAVEQSGKSKEADKVGEEEGLAYLASVLETGERQTANVYHDFIKSKETINVAYPKGFSLKTPEERQAEVDALRQRRTAVRSETAAKLIDKRIAKLQLEESATPEELAKVMQEIDAQPFIDDDAQRAEAIRADVDGNLLSHARGSELRGHVEQPQFPIVLVEQSALADAMTGTQLTLPESDADLDKPLPGDDDDKGDDDKGDDADDAEETETDDGETDDEKEDDEAEDAA